ncbi:MAG TPA: hypothetical protein VEQ59_18820, partial [Polyangiaceae bacterium]|nr:hypothetical protein [Polyangiaceae bacterium]
MKEKRSLVALGALTLALTACGSATSDKNDTGPGGPNGSNPGGTTGGTTGTGVGGSSTGIPGAGTSGDGSMLPPDGPCQMGIPITTQIPRMLNRQYGNVVRDILGVTSIDG